LTNTKLPVPSVTADRRVDDTGGADVDDLAGPVAEVLNNGARASASVPEYTRPSWAAQEWVAAAA
jgi:hypothetical protein